MKKLLISLIVLLYGLSGYAQLHFSFVHYTSDNGLSQNSITAMLKDRKGYMWFGTRNGLSKFDGYNFTVYNNRQNPKLAALSNRILSLKEDKNGYMWIKTYDEIVYRLDPRTEDLIRIPHPDGGTINDKIADVIPLSDGTVWLTTTGNGCFKTTPATDDQKLQVVYFHTKHNNSIHNTVKTVFEDSNHAVWLLTAGGLACHEPGGQVLNYYTDVRFISYFENDKRILFGTNHGIYVYEKRNHIFNSIMLPPGTSVSSISGLNANNFLVCSKENGFFTLDLSRKAVEAFNCAKYPQMKTNEIEKAYIDRSGEAWLEIKAAGIIHFIPRDRSVEYIPTRLNEGQVWNPNFLIFEDDKDLLWIQPYFGSFSWYNRSTHTLTPFNSAYNEELNTLISYGINHVLSDSQGVMWISTNRGNGVFKCTFLPEYFKHILFQEHPAYGIANEIRSIYEDSEKRLWIGCKDGIVHVFDEQKKEIGQLHTDGRIIPGGKAEILVYNFFEDKDKNMWISTKRDGIYRLHPRGTNQFTIENYRHTNDPYSPANNDFYSITQDKYGRIWAGSYGEGLHLLEEKDGKIRFLHARNALSSYPIANCSKVRHVFADSKGYIWVSTTEGLVVFDSRFQSVGKIRYNYFHKDESKAGSLSANDVHCVFEDTESQIWIGTFGGGLNKLQSPYNPKTTPAFQLIDYKNGLPDNLVYTITDDHQGNLWLTTENSIVKYTKKNGHTEVFGRGNELANVEFSEASACLLRSGEICVGSKSGFYSFQPAAVRRNVIPAPLVFTRLLLFNKEVEVGQEPILQEHLDQTKQVEFNHKQNVFTIEFATLDMRAPDKIQYAYKLDGFDADWNYVQTKHFATYTSLPPGTYTFRVKSTDSEGVWLNNERSIELHILPSFWQSGFAMLLYFILVVLLFWGTLYFYLTYFKMKHNVMLEQQMSEMKLKFFTDISHELRTPLTLISLPIDNIMQEKLDPHVKEQMMLVRRNLDKVMGLINKILDFRKIQNNKMRLSVEEISAGKFIQQCSSNFNEMAASKHIRFELIDESNEAKLWADPERLDSIVTNLLSNAFKFTPAGKRITIRLSTRQQQLILEIKDEGIGIAQEKINFIFERFFSMPALQNLTQKSTGIGLDLVKKLVELHHASIEVESQPGKGTSFKITFRNGYAHFEGDADIILKDFIQEEADAPTDTEQDDGEEQDAMLPTLLIVEDNEELRHFLTKSLRRQYRVVHAENGQAGLSKTIDTMPDLIITDLLMPEMDGLEMTRFLKEDKRTSHIPVILLTAVTDMDSKLEALKSGCDEYITKPFSSEFLQARIENLMSQRKQLQDFYRTQLILPKPDFSLPPLEVKSQEETFMHNLIKLMNENLDNFELNIDFLASESGMSRTVFFNKLKSLTGFSPVEFVREVRFERAAEYMKNTQLTVSEISYQVGIEDPRYFSRCFKQKFGMTPSEYRNKYSEQ